MAVAIVLGFFSGFLAYMAMAMLSAAGAKGDPAADADLNHAIVSGCLRREPAMDFLSANDADLEGVPDPRVLALAADQERILVSHDFQTMPRHSGAFLETQGFSPGVFLVKQYSPVADVIDDLVLVWAASDGDEWKNRIPEIPL